MPEENITKTEDHDHGHGTNRFAVIPTPDKLSVDQELSGRGVTVAFLDSGFFPHPDCAARVKEFHDVTGEESVLHEIRKPAGHHWHGTQTVVSCAGDGSLSDGIYRGLASDSDLVLVKVSSDGRIPDANIESGLRWVLENRARLAIRVLNISLGGDGDLPSEESTINRLAEQLVREGVVVTVAAGNNASSRPIPPASAPSVITVGGYSDENGLGEEGFDLYHSSFGETADGLVKPEIIAPAMFVAAPILPGTPDYETAELLSMLSASPDYALQNLSVKEAEAAGIDAAAGVDEVRNAVERELRRRKIVATHYQHVDGTSFAAPIAASVAALMLEANPSLTPETVKNILVATASRLSGFPAVRQGYGILNARAAVTAAIRESHFLSPAEYRPPRVEGRKIVFSFHADDAGSVNLVGDFNGWDRGSIPFKSCRNGLWCASIPCQPAGLYRYKILVNGYRWSEDHSHGLKEDDGFGGFNSILEVV